MEQEFKRNWKNRYSIEPEIRGSLEDYWESENQLYYLIVPVGPVRDELARVLDELEIFEGLEAYRKEFLHMTVKVFGSEKPDIEKIERVLNGFRSFKADFRDLNLFPEAVVVEALIPEIRAINKSMCEIGFKRFPHDGESYLPHISLAHYRNSNWDQIVSSIEGLRDVDISSFTVDELVLVRDLTSSEKPDFESVRRFNLD